MRKLLALAAVVLAGCTTSGAGLSRMEASTVYHSSQPARAFATCVAGSLLWDAELRGDTSHYWILRKNAGLSGMRWDFTDQPYGGSIAELHGTSIVSAVKDKVQACAR